MGIPVTVADSARRLGAVASRWFRPLAAIATVVGVALALLSQREAIRTFDWHLDPRVLALSVLGFAATSLVQGVAFYAVLRGLGRHPRFAGCLVVWTRSFLARYAPSGALALVVRLREAERLDADRSLIISASGYEQLIALVSGSFVALLGFLAAKTDAPWYVYALCAASLVGLGLAAPRIGGRHLAGLIERRFHVTPTLLKGRVLVAICLLNALGWLTTGAGAWLLVEAVTDDAPSYPWILAVYALGVMVGFVVPLLPGGLGLREGVMVSLLAPRYGVGAATTLVLALRLVATFGELAAIGIGEAIGLVPRRDRSPSA